MHKYKILKKIIALFLFSALSICGMTGCQKETSDPADSQTKDAVTDLTDTVPVTDLPEITNAVVEDVKASFDAATGTLTISGTGNMIDISGKDVNPLFEYQENTVKIIIEKGISGIGNYSFRKFSNLKSVSIPDGVTRIGCFAFAECENLSEISLPDTLKTIDYGAFQYCYALPDINFPDSLRTIGDYAFISCRSMKNITLNEGLTSIGGSAFTWCENLESIAIPDSVTSIGTGVLDNTKCNKVFIDNKNYVSDYWNDGVLYIGNHLIEVDTDKTGSFTVKEGTITIAGRAFNGCGNLTDVFIPNSVISIGEEAFQGCSSLKSITVPNKASIGKFCFYFCSSLTEVRYADPSKPANLTIDDNND